MTSSVQSHLRSERCLYERQCPLQEHGVFEDLGVVAGGDRSGWSHARAMPEADEVPWDASRMTGSPPGGEAQRGSS